MFFKKGRLRSVSKISSSASRGWRGKDDGEVLHVLMAQVRKLSVRSFIVAFREGSFRKSKVRLDFWDIGEVCVSGLRWDVQ